MRQVAATLVMTALVCVRVSAVRADGVDDDELIAAEASLTAPAGPAPAPADELGDREVGVGLGLASGGTFTAGGVRIAGRFLYRLSDDDWFDGAAAFTYGSNGSASCDDTSGQVQCDGGRLSGLAVEVTAGFRRRFVGNGRFVPHVRAAIGVRLVRFGADDLAGIGVPLVAAGGFRVRVTPNIAVGAEAALEVGAAWFDRGVGAKPQAGLVVGGQVEFRLR